MERWSSSCFGAKKQLAKCKTTSIDVNKTVVNNSEVVKYLCTWMDCNLTFKDHIFKKCRTAMINLQRIKLIRPFLKTEACTTLTLGLVITHLDYCNSYSSWSSGCKHQSNAKGPEFGS